MTFAKITKMAHKIRKAIVNQFGVKAGQVSWKLCFAIAKNGGNDVTTINAMNYNESFKNSILNLEKIATNIFRYYINNKPIGLIIGNSQNQVRKILTDRFNIPNVFSIGVVPVH